MVHVARDRAECHTLHMHAVCISGRVRVGTCKRPLFNVEYEEDECGAAMTLAC